MLKKLLSFGKKSNGFYLELDETKDSQSSNGVAAPPPAAVAKPEPAPVAQPPVAVESKPEPAKVEAVKPEAVKTKSPSKKTSIKNRKKKSAATITPEVPTNSDTPAVESLSSDKAVEDGSKANNGKVVEPEAPLNFATDYLMPTVTKYRRRPGGSLNKFKEMASQAKTPRG